MSAIRQQLLDKYPFCTTEVQIRIHNCGMCMTDVHLLDTGAVGFLKLTSPYVMGHEIGGVVSKVGPDVTNVKPGRLPMRRFAVIYSELTASLPSMVLYVHRNHKAY